MVRRFRKINTFERNRNREASQLRYRHFKSCCLVTPYDAGGLGHQNLVMMTSSNETFSAFLALCAGNSPVTGEFLAQRPVTRSFDVLFDLRLNKRVSKQSWGWWFETPWRSLWRHCNGEMVRRLFHHYLDQCWFSLKWTFGNKNKTFSKSKYFHYNMIG